MKRNATIALMLALLVFLSACSAKSSSMSDAAASEQSSTNTEASVSAEESYGVTTDMAYSGSASKAEAPAPAPVDTAKDAGIRKIIYTADLSITSDDPAAALETLTARAKELDGYLAGSYMTTDELGAYRCTATIKVPAEKLEELVQAAEKTGRVDSYQLSSDDISLSYYDIEARLKSAKAEEEQLTAILKDCKTVEEILAVRQSLAEVRSDIESDQGQINLWDNLVAYATLELTVFRTQRAAVEGDGEPIAIWKASDVFKKMSLGFTNSARFVVNAVGAIGIFLAYVILPGAIVFAIVMGILLINRKTKPCRAAHREAKRLKREHKLAEKAAKSNQKKNE